MNVVGACGIPPAAQAYVLSATAVTPGSFTSPGPALGTLSLGATNGSQPATLHGVDGWITSNMSIVAAANGKVPVYASDSTHLILDINAYFSP